MVHRRLRHTYTNQLNMFFTNRFFVIVDNLRFHKTTSKNRINTCTSLQLLDILKKSLNILKIICSTVIAKQFTIENIIEINSMGFQ
jgi:hypothetical protein